MFRSVIFKVVLILVFSATFARADDTCANLAEKWDSENKFIASTYVSRIGDRSAPRETNRLLREKISTIRKNMVLTLLSRHECPLPTTLTIPFGYTMAAMECNIAA